MALLYQECLHLASSGPMASPIISQKDVELKFLKAHLFSLQNPPPMPTSMPYDPFSPFTALRSVVNYSHPLPQLPQNQNPFFDSSSLFSSEKLENTYKKRQHTPPKEKSSHTKTANLNPQTKENYK
ncbi:hypothetical protein LIER_35454 [Lithospermum erythrorhizon]|uniref:Uncharacterized protein n=1 Tax=Lithospermum erythrorhizon TaxID=34254 RepID=A0AAV3NQW0_LITER